MDWRIVDDGVMGGLSKGKVTLSDSGVLRFSGKLSLENNGGFSSIRTARINLDLSNSKGLTLRVKGDGRTYQLRLSTDARYRSDEVSFKADFPTTKGKWIELKVPFSKFTAGWRGRTLKNKFDPAKIQRLGLLLGDKKAGPFQLEVDWIRAYGSTGTGTDSGNIVETAIADGRFKTLATALTKAELVDALQGDGPLTVFAPTDRAFAKLPEKTLATLLQPSNKGKLQAILKYHVASGRAELSDALKAASVETLQGESVNVVFVKGKVQIEDATLIDADIDCSNGIIHVIDSVLLPPEPKPKTILQVASQAGSFSKLLAAIDAAGLSSTLDGEGPFTVFAPTDEAIDRLPENTVTALLNENRDQLKEILTYHVVSGRVSAGDALEAGSAETVNGQTINFAIRDGKLQVNDSTIRKVDIDCANGVIHVIDRVIFPPSREKEKTEAAELKQEGDPESRAIQLIVNAIAKGVPLYNHGDPAACADVYAACIKTLAKNEQLNSDVRKRLAKVLKQAMSTKNAYDRAWLLRKNLDGTLASLMH